MKNFGIIFIIFACVIEIQAQESLRLGRSEIIFASVKEAKEILTKKDDYVQRLSPFDLSARMMTSKVVTEEDYFRFVETHIMEWKDEDKRKIIEIWDRLKSKLELFPLPFPETMYLIKTTGDEEGGAAYTRSNAVILPEESIRKPILEGLICHELFHILSRYNKPLRDKLYTTIGFVNCKELVYPPDLKDIRITNPDSPIIEHCIRVTVEDQQHWAIPVLYSFLPQYDDEKGGKFFDYMQLQFLLVDRDETTLEITPLYNEKHELRLFDLDELEGLFEKIGVNTNYIIHPEETVAVNFTLMVMGQKRVRSPGILEEIKKIVSECKR